MGRCSAALLAAIDRSIVLAECDLPDGTTKRITNRPGGFQSATNGFYEQRIVGRPSGWSENTGDSEGAMQILTMNMTIADDDWWFRDLIGCGAAVDNIPVRLKRAAPVEDVPSAADWLTYYTGVLDDFAERQGNTWSLKLRPDDAEMLSPVLKRKAQTYDFPALPAANEGRFLPLIVGLHDYSGAASGTTYGAIETFSVNDSTFLRYVGLGYNRVLRVWVGSTLKVLTTDYTVIYPLINGVRHTIVDLVADPGSSSVRVDVEGQYAGGSSGLPVMASVDVTRLVLNDHVFGAYLDGAHLAESSRMYTTGWDALATPFLKLAGGACYTSSVFIDDDRTGYDFVNEMNFSQGWSTYWRGDGTLAPFYDNRNALPTITATLKEADCLKFAIQTPKDQLIGSSFGQFGLASGEGRYGLLVSNPLAASSRTESPELIYAPNVWP